MPPYRHPEPLEPSPEVGLRVEVHCEDWRDPRLLGQYVARVFYDGKLVAATLGRSPSDAKWRALFIAREKLGPEKVPR